jgi:hypothetical protein
MIATLFKSTEAVRALIAAGARLNSVNVSVPEHVIQCDEHVLQPRSCMETMRSLSRGAQKFSTASNLRRSRVGTYRFIWCGVFGEIHKACAWVGYHCRTDTQEGACKYCLKER